MANVSAVNSSAAAAQNSAAKPPVAGDQVSKDTFLKLLVAQIKNQNPLDPADGVQFVTQLAQFTEMEQMMDIRSAVQAIQNDLKPPAVPRPQADSPRATV
jgi:flagellar basal-body rod modification protein FlgD